LPMALTVRMCTNRDTGKVTMHALDFDLVCVADDEAEANRKIRLAIKNYIEFGLTNDWSEDILFPAPDEYWQQIANADIIVMGEPIQIMAQKMLVYRATTCHEAHADRRIAVSA